MAITITEKEKSKTKTPFSFKEMFFDFKHVKGDVFGGITAGIVALPLALAFRCAVWNGSHSRTVRCDDAWCFCCCFWWNGNTDKRPYRAYVFGFTSRFQELIKELDPGIKVLIIRMKEVPYIDQSGVFVLEEAILELRMKGVIVLMTGVQPQPLDMMKKIDIIPGLISEERLFKKFADCEKWLKYNLKNISERLKKNTESANTAKGGKWDTLNID